MERDQLPVESVVLDWLPVELNWLPVELDWHPVELDWLPVERTGVEESFLAVERVKGHHRKEDTTCTQNLSCPRERLSH